MKQRTPTARTPVPAHVPAKALIHVAVADRHPAMRLGWKIMLDEIGGYTVTVSVADGEGLVAACKAGTPVDIALIDLHMEGMNGYTTLAWLHEERPQVRTVAVCHVPDDMATKRALQLHANGVLVQAAEPEELAAALHDVALIGFHRNTLVDRLLLHPDGTPRTLKELRGTPREKSPLCKREEELLIWWAHPDGLSNRAIAVRMGITLGTLKVYSRNIHAKLGIGTRAEAVVFAFEHKLVFR